MITGNNTVVGCKKDVNTTDRNQDNNWKVLLTTLHHSDDPDLNYIIIISHGPDNIRSQR